MIVVQENQINNTLKIMGKGSHDGDGVDEYPVEGYHLVISSQNLDCIFRSGKKLISKGSAEKVLQDAEEYLQPGELDYALSQIGVTGHNSAHFGMQGFFLFTEKAEERHPKKQVDSTKQLH